MTTFTTKIKLVSSISIALLLAIVSCKKDSKIQPSTTWEGLNFPSHIPEPHYKFINNQPKLEVFELGRMLFYDPILSRDSTVSCATCHGQEHFFADHNTSLSIGIENKKGVRNSPPLFNLAWMTNFMWDGGINHIEIMPLAPITNPVEMDESMLNVILKLKRNNQYKNLFKKAFGDEEINDQKLFKALAQFMSKITSFESKYDRVKDKKDQFSFSENEGYKIFKNHCNSCHTEPLFFNNGYANNGLDNKFKDKGRYLITLDSNDLGKFKIPTLRNLKLTYPYMHDGRFRTIESVLEHYTKNIVISSTLDKKLETKIALSEQEKLYLIDFLNTLNDYELLSKNIFNKPK